MNVKSDNIPLVILIIAVILAVFATYYRFIVVRNYDIYMQVSCNPQSETCYKSVGCPQDLPDCSDPQTTYYKILRIKAFELSSCDHNVGVCPDPVCKPGMDCAYISCNPTLNTGAQMCGADSTE